MKKFLEEFKAFALRGNVIDMAIGVVVGGAFTAIVTAVKDNFIMPIIEFIMGNAAYTEADIKTFIAAIISSIIYFIITAFVLFCIIKAINKASELGKKKEEPEAPTTKVCPFCKSEIAIDATRCPHCTSEQPAEEA
ncbi:MAG: large conductance mechanosensitive channel protein MscL [Lachnospiraceae bacterium]|nr:large conductance mechanosensitive channel protein MscL [Lachnospiraceae bacterium]